MPKPLTLKPNADALPPTVCHILDCDAKGHARGLCSPHYAAAVKAGRLDELALPSTQKARKPKAVAPTAPKPTFAEIVPDEDLRVPSVPAVVIPSSPSGELEKLRAERDAAIARAEAAEKAQAELEEAEGDLLDESIEVARELGIDTDGDYDLIARAREVMSILEFVRAERDAANGRAEQAERAMRDLESLVRSEFAYAPGVIDLFDWVRDIASKVREVKLRFEDWEARGVVSAVTLEHVCAELGIKRDGDADWVLAQLRERIKGDAAKLAAAKSVEDLLRSERAEMLPWHDAARECADVLGIDTPEGLIQRARDAVKPPANAVRCGSALVFEVGGETPTATLIGDQDAIKAFGRLGLYRELPVYEVEAGLLMYAPKT